MGEVLKMEGFHGKREKNADLKWSEGVNSERRKMQEYWRIKELGMKN